ncbi:MAG: HDOD domain-containing protein [Phycisphaerales bacterium]
MSTETADKQAIVENAVREISQIAMLPEITIRIIELVEDPNSTANDLHQIISNDPALCARILKVVNSSFYGLPGQIGSINRAIVLLGLNAVKNIAISASLAKLFRGGQLSPHFSARDLWTHSVAAATAAKVIADEMKVASSDEAFLAGLVHDLGIMVEMQYDRQKLIEVIERVAPDKDGVPSGNMLEAELEIFGATHQDFGRALATKWKFPKTLVDVVSSHHAPMGVPEASRKLPCLIHAADRVAGTIEGGFRLDLTSLDHDPAVLDALGLKAEQLDALHDRIVEEVENVKAMLG